ncbi:MAG: PAS domain-containing sensor histidine kinase [Clostridiales bacterium]|nr:PAS domain-containing sensor histidine kinase [Candidatus Apopatocola equi]
MTKRIFRSICLVAIAVFLASLVLIMGVLYSYFSDRQMISLKTETALCASAVEHDGLDYLASVSNGDYRITWISADGTVLFDNKAETAKMENHLEREEIREALSGGSGESVRRSDTLLEKQLYSARKLSDGTVIRLSASHLTWWSLIFSMLRHIVLVMAIAIGLSLYLAYRLSKRVVKPLNELNLDEPEENSVYEELSPLVDRIASQQRQLKTQQAELRRKQEEFDTATGYMNEGILLLSETRAVLSINKAATKLLGISRYCLGRDLLLFNSSPEIQELLRIAGTGSRAEKIVSIAERDYQFNASPILSEDKVSGIALIIFDITEKEKAEEARREFTANVSHELKTPLQNISGSAELLSNGLVRPEDVPQFAEQIFSESRRMITLVEDIIKLSHLDEGAEDMQRQTLDLYELAAQTVRSLLPVAQSAGVELTLRGEKAELQGIAQLLSGIIYNLCDNSIKYNHAGGSVEVEVRPEGANVVLTISDTGIGIPPEAQERIFERFYRVDKSRSKSVGGTGLGLSIVKHSIKLHGGSIEIRSIVDHGTTMIITLPKSPDGSSV